MFAWLFKHPRALYQQGELVFAGEFGVLWWLAAALLLGLSIFFARRLRGWSLWRRVTIHGLQLAAVALVLALLAQPALEVLRLAAGANTVAVLVDASESMALPSGEGEAESRFDVAARLVDERLVRRRATRRWFGSRLTSGCGCLGQGKRRKRLDSVRGWWMRLPSWRRTMPRGAGGRGGVDGRGAERRR